MSRLSRARNHLASGLQFYASLPLGQRVRSVRWAQQLAGKLAGYVSAPEPAPPVAAAPRPPAVALDQAPLGNPAVAVQVFGKAGDLWTGRATRLFEERGVACQYVDLDAGTELRLSERLTAQTRRTEPPWIFLRGEHIGGFHELDEIDRLGQLETRLLPPSERARDPRGRTRIVIAGRDPS